MPMAFCSASPSVTVLSQCLLAGATSRNTYPNLRSPLLPDVSEVDDDRRPILFPQNDVPGVDVIVCAPMARSPAMMLLDMLATSCSETSIPGWSLSILTPEIYLRASPLTMPVI
ncbi:hypothetical protein EDD85DRAFT_853907, partial [Armillaria nabsnona]